ncbi:MAG: DUF1566 domain-containing protein [Leptospiraceae bacterium]|nr:DUF1566 domain-containing protein [Leptospiraceae bacterium]MCP5493559.1 DUF1566 domain-containing protein [Leptospiraceae bacterium]
MKNIGLFILLLVCNCNFSFKSDFDNIGDSIAFVLLEPTSSESGSGFAIADSGSTTCYDDSVSITCTGVSGSYPRQDGDYIDIPKARSFTGPTPHETYTSDYTTKDNVTGLVWKTCSEGQTGSDCTGTATTYTKDSAKTLCSNLNSSNGGNGYANTKSWRLPYLVELNTLVDYGKSSPTIDQTNFPATKSFRYWSLTSLSGSTSSSWTTDFNTGTSKNYSNYDYQNVRCVSNGLQTDNIQSFTDNGDYTITDKATALVWQKCSMGQNSDDTCSGTATTTTWSNALLYCKDLSLAGKTWRLPNINELKSIMNYDKSEPGINQTYFPATQPSLYWSSTTYLITTTYAWNIDFQYGEIDDYGLLKTSGIYVRCVSD